MSAASRDFRPFLEELTLTQQFDDFVTKRMYSSLEPDVIFFNQSIDAKKNRSILNRKKADVDYLNAANAHKDLQQYVAIPPNSSNVPSGLSTKVGEHGFPVFEYPSWPQTFELSLFCPPTPIPRNIAKEFERRSELKKKLSTIASEIKAERKQSESKGRSLLSVMVSEIKEERGY